MRILLAMTTGRRIFRCTLDMLAANIARHGHHDRHWISLALNIDPSYENVASSEFTYQPSAVFREVITITESDIARWRHELINYGLSKESVDTLLQTTGYGNKKNLVMLHALRCGYDVVVFWDDDEYPIACLRSESSGLKWTHTDVLGAHLATQIAELDVASGFRTGHGAPLTPELQRRFSPQTASALGEALSLGTEFITADYFCSETANFILPDELPWSREIVAQSGGKWVAGGNVSVRATGLRSGRVPPFYVPPAARGDDTFFSMQLGAARVWSVRSGIFHDCFQQYTTISEEEYPESFSAVHREPSIYVGRLASALRGWVAYSPLMLRLRDAVSWRRTLTEMHRLLSESEEGMARDFPELIERLGGATSLTNVLMTYSSAVDLHYDSLQGAAAAWRSAVARN